MVKPLLSLLNQILNFVKLHLLVLGLVLSSCFVDIMRYGLIINLFLIKDFLEMVKSYFFL